MKKEETNTEKKDKTEEKQNVDKLLPVKKSYPNKLVVIPIYQKPLFPSMILPMLIERPESVAALKHSIEKLSGIVVFSLIKSKEGDKEIDESKICKIGVVAQAVKFIESKEKEVQAIFEILTRTKIQSFLQKKPFLLADLQHIDNQAVKNTDTIKVYSRELLSNVRELIRMYPIIKDELNQYLNTNISINDVHRLSDFTASILTVESEQLQEILEEFNILERLKKILILIKKEIYLGKLQAKISSQIEKKISKNQREFFLREQLKEIKKELGMTKDSKTSEVEELVTKAAKLNLSPEAKEVFDEEINKLYSLDNSSPEFSVSKNYLDWIVSLPWGKYAEDTSTLQKAQKILDQDHYGLEDIKERILEFIAVSKLAKKDNSSIICFVGPPGVGKTSLGKSIAKVLNRPFFRFSVGGMRDESEIKGHRRTYIGSMPGKFIQMLKQAKVANPVIMVDEIDKMSNSYHGDPASALLEVFDAEQNSTFLDHYLDIPFDLSKIFFLTTANQLDTISDTLLDRMECLRLSGYIVSEKLQIAKRYIIPKQKKAHGLKNTQLNITDSAITKIIEGYARESGVRNLENLIKKICRKIATKISYYSEITRKNTKITVDVSNVEKYLNNPIFTDEQMLKIKKIGLVNGLAWTSMGGDVLVIEAIKIDSEKKDFKQTGQLGAVMIESAEIAYSYVYSNWKKFGGKKNFFEKNFIHLHVPAGATPKDGPSAGITMASALISLMLQKVVDKNIGMTGELTLTGTVLPIGGLKEKVIAAKRNKLTEIIVPLANKRDHKELPKHLKEDLKIHFVSNYEKVFKILFNKKL